MTDTHTDRQTDTSDFIICPMLCYGNGTDNKCPQQQRSKKFNDVGEAMQPSALYTRDRAVLPAVIDASKT